MILSNFGLCKRRLSTEEIVTKHLNEYNSISNSNINKHFHKGEMRLYYDLHNDIVENAGLQLGIC